MLPRSHHLMPLGMFAMTECGLLLFPKLSIQKLHSIEFYKGRGKFLREQVLFFGSQDWGAEEKLFYMLIGGLQNSPEF